MMLHRSSHPVIAKDREWERGSQLAAVAAVPKEEGGGVASCVDGTQRTTDSARPQCPRLY